MSTGEENVEMIQQEEKGVSPWKGLERGREWLMAEAPFLASFTTSATYYFFLRVKAAGI